MDKSVYENRAKEIVAEIKGMIDAKGLNVESVSDEIGIPTETLNQFFSGESIPNLS